MKNSIYLILAIILIGCSKEDNLEHKINFDAPYVIVDNPNDEVQHERYLIYEKYKVPVFFSDTINEVFVTNNIYGEPVYKYETLDLNWYFFTAGSVNYKFQYFDQKEKKLRALKGVEIFLENTAKSLKPFSILLVDEFEAPGGPEIITINDQINTPPYGNSVKCLNSFRTLVISSSDKDFSNDFWKNLSATLTKNQVKSAITGEKYKIKLTAFSEVSDKSWYDKYWNLSNSNLGVESSFNANNWKNFDPKAEYGPIDDAYFTYVRQVFGRFGFIGHSESYGFSSSPQVASDRNQYIEAMFAYSRERFEELWGHSPLNMEKYEILYDIIVNDMMVPLEEIVK
jgi:hypothetical protein